MKKLFAFTLPWLALGLIFMTADESDSQQQASTPAAAMRSAQGAMIQPHRFMAVQWRMDEGLANETTQGTVRFVQGPCARQEHCADLRMLSKEGHAFITTAEGLQYPLIADDSRQYRVTLPHSTNYTLHYQVAAGAPAMTYLMEGARLQLPEAAQLSLSKATLLPLSRTAGRPVTQIKAWVDQFTAEGGHHTHVLDADLTRKGLRIATPTTHGVRNLPLAEGKGLLTVEITRQHAQSMERGSISFTHVFSRQLELPITR